MPDGDILVAESTTEPLPPKSIEDRVAIWLQKYSGANGKSANRITLLRDTKGAGVGDTRWIFLGGLHQPFGMLVLGDKFYVGDTDGLMRFPYKPNATTIDGQGETILALPKGGYNNHWTRNVFANADGTKLYVTVGSGSNVGEHGPDNEIHRANILEINPDGSGLRIVASGLRNPNGLAYEPTTHALWTVVNERDMLGNDLTPDYLTHVVDGGFYGWPYSYWGRHVDTRVTPQRPDLVAKAITPDYSLGSHVAPLGLAFYDGTAFPASYRGGAFVGEHGSWNRKPFSGYKVVFVPFKDGQPAGDTAGFPHGIHAGRSRRRGLWPARRRDRRERRFAARRRRRRQLHLARGGEVVGSPSLEGGRIKLRSNFFGEGLTTGVRGLPLPDKICGFFDPR